ncbi:glycosyltransferase [Dankookia rubra]|uniref:Glycosyltransferase n=1 Tax=Dankookia rubra TaxID=1442381 RepID=A0A4R5QC67_9PROT|nr:glycosyltransferase [Dankookia rubra]TDH60011.1 glycosyltransferase [Dankookia rubra]
MNYLFVHQNFPGQYLHVLRRLAAERRHEIVFISLPNHNQIPGVRRIDYRPLRGPSPGIHRDATEFEAAMIRAQAVAETGQRLAAVGFQPDIMIGHNGWGELLNLKDVWPGVPLIPYFEFFYHDAGLDVGFDQEFPLSPEQRSQVRAKNAVNLLGLQLADRGQTPTAFQRNTYPAWARRKLALVPEGVDLAYCRPRWDVDFALPAIGRRWSRQGRRLVTYVARNLEPYRGIHVLLRAIPRILADRADVDVVVVGGDEVSYGPAPEHGTWRERLLAELGSAIDPDRVFFPGKLAYADYLTLLQVSSVHVYLTYPFVASWSLREALACGCALVASDTAPVREFVSDRETGRLVFFDKPAEVALAVLELLEDTDQADRLRRNARHWAETHLDLASHLTAFKQVTKAAHRACSSTRSQLPQ